MLKIIPLVAIAAVFAPVAMAAAAKPYTVDKMETGLEVVSMESPKVPLVTIVLASKAGGMSETPETNGLTHLWEHMFFKGNARLPNQEAFNRRIRQLGIIYNGDTWAEQVRYYFTMPSAFLEEGLQFMADAIATPLLEEKELAKERRVVLDEYDRSASQPGFDLRRLSKKIIYGDKDYLRDPLGDRKLIAKATRKQLLEIKRKVFVPSNSALLVAGDFDKAELLKLVKKHFSSWKNPKGWKPLEPNKFPPFPKSQRIVMTRKHARSALLRMTYKGPKARSQPKDSFAADMLYGLLANKTGRFYKKFHDSGLTLQSGVSYMTQSQAGEVDVYAMSQPEKIVAAEKALKAEISEWTKPKYFTQTQLKDVKRSLLIDYKREVNKPSAYVKTLAYWWNITGFEYYNSYLENLRAVSLKDVRKFVTEYLVNKPAVTTILLSPEGAKKAGLKDNSEALLKQFKLAAGA